MDTDLAEVAAPEPVSRLERGTSLESRESDIRSSIDRERRKSHHSQPRQLSLSENAAPPPVDDEHDKEQPLESRFDSDVETSTPSPEVPQELKRKDHGKGSFENEPRSSFLTELYTISWLIFFSFWGTLARLGVEAITLYPNTPFPSRVLWANLGGSFILGLLTEDRRLFREEWGHPDPDASWSTHGKVKKTIPLYIGLATGFCGCFTSFSSFMRDGFLALTNALEPASPTSPYHVDHVIPHRNGGFSFEATLAVLIIHPAVSLSALIAGAHFALLLQPVAPVIPFRLVRRFLDPLAVVLAFGCWIGAVLLAIFPPGDRIHWRTRATMPLIFSPPGVLLRFYASRYLNSRLPSFPLGTFCVNIFGTMVLGMAWDLQHASSIGALSANSCAVLHGIMEGFCGCLTTVSTWVLELSGLRRRHAWLYGLTSVGVGLGAMVVIMGSMGWTVGFTVPVCS
jgi:fluoride exporter